VLEHRALRFAVEALTLAAIAAALAVAQLRPLVIAGGMLLAWAVVALLEWAFLQGESHYASGLPPRYYIPELLLPPPRQIEPPPVDAHRPAALEPPGASELEPLTAPADPPPIAIEPVPEADAGVPPAETLDLTEEAQENDLDEPEPDVPLPAAPVWPPEPVEASWFDSELPGGADDSRLLDAALADLEVEWSSGAGAVPPVAEEQGEPRPPGERRVLPGRLPSDS